MAILAVKNLKIEYKTNQGALQAIDDVSFTLEKGESLGVVGESGCGKSTIMKSILRLLPENAQISGGQILFKGTDIIPMNEKELRQLRWRGISLVTQGAMNAFNPVYRIGEQIVEVMVVQGGMDEQQAKVKAVELFRTVGLDEKRLMDYPHQLSGGMRQRSMIAMAIALNPDVVVADEPTTALDVIIQDRILQSIAALQKKMGLSMIFVTHDISIVAEICHKTMIMYAGKIAEMGTTRSIFKQAYHPYTLGLMYAFPDLRADIAELISIPGYPPNLIHPPAGCRFEPRCPFQTELCQQQSPPLIEVEPGHVVACHYTEKVNEFREQAVIASTWKGVAQ